MNAWNKFIKPIVVLTVICIIVSGALALTNSITQPIIAKNADIAANAGRYALLPEADGFTAVETDIENVLDCYSADNGAGYVITGVGKGYGGDLPVMVGFDADGKITGISISETSETPGLGKKVEEPAFTDQFKGLASESLTLNTEVQQIASATISSNAVVKAVNAAIGCFNFVAKGVEVEEEVVITMEQQLAMFAEANADAAAVETDIENVLGAYQAADGTLAVWSQGKGYSHEDEDTFVGIMVVINTDGTVKEIYVDASTQTDGLGTKVAEPAFTDTIIGVASSEEVMPIAGATKSSHGVTEALSKAYELFAQLNGTQEEAAE